MSVNGYSKTILVGNIGKDAVVKRTEANTRASFTFATTTRTDKEKKPITDWHNVIIWGKRADAVGDYLKKGKRLLLEGEYRTREYTDEQNQRRYISELVCTNLVFLGGDRSNDSNSSTATPDSQVSSNNGLPADGIPF